MRRINIRFLVGTLLCVLLMAGLVHALHSVQYRHQARALKNVVESHKDYKDSHVISAGERIEELRRYTTLVQDQPEYLNELGGCLDELGTLLKEAGLNSGSKSILREANLTIAAALNLYKAEPRPNSDPDMLRLRRDLVDTALATGRVQDAESQLTELYVRLEYVRDAQNIRGAIKAALKESNWALEERLRQSDYREALARIRISQGSWPEAIELLNEAVVLDPARRMASALLADAEATHFHNYAEAREVLDEMVEANPETAEAYVIRGEYRLQQLVRGPGSEKAVPTEANLTPEEVSSKWIDETRSLALADAERAMALSPDNRDAMLLAMRCEFSFRDRPEESLESVSHLDKAAKLAQQLIAACDMEFEKQLHKIEEELTLRERQKRKHADATAHEQPAAPKPATVSAATREALQASIYGPAADAYNVLAASQDSSVDAMNILRDGLVKIPGDESLLLNLASLKIAEAGDAEQEAIDEVIDLLRGDQEPLADYLQARLTLAQGKLHAGLAEFKKVRERLDTWPTIKAEADRSIGECHLRLGEPRLAADFFRHATERNPDSVPALLGLAAALRQTGIPGDRDRAQEIYSQLSQRSVGISGSERTAALIEYVRLIQARYAPLPANREEWTRLLEFIEEIRASLVPSRESNMEMDLLKADVQFASGSLKAAEKTLLDGVERDPQSARLWASLALLRTQLANAPKSAEPEGDAATDPGAKNSSGSDPGIETLRAAEEAIAAPTPEDRTVLQIAKARHCLVTRPVDEARPQLQQMAEEVLRANSATEAAISGSSGIL